MGLWLLEKERRFRLKELAKRLEVTERTLNNWKNLAANGDFPKPGRRGYADSQRRDAIWRVGRALRQQGYPGWRAVKAQLGSDVPTRLVQEYVRLFKQKRKQRTQRMKGRTMVRVSITRKNAVWTQDGMHAGRCKGQGVEAQVIKDRASMRLVSA